jgi:hypothetical protein
MKQQFPFLQLPVAFDADALAAEVLAIEESAWLPHPNGLPGNTALTLITTEGVAESNRLYGPMLPTKHLRRMPYLMQVLASIGATWGRSRLMRLSGQAEVRTHVDIHYYWRERMRVHVPIVTQPTVRFHCGDAMINMAAGECWIFDTWRPHRVVNDDSRSRIHLVADTVGGRGFWELADAGRPAGADMPGWQPRRVPPVPGLPPPALDFEMVNAPVVMSPWEMRDHIRFLLGEVVPSPQLPAVEAALLRLARRWHALWSCYAEAQEGWPRYRALLDEAAGELQQVCSGVMLRNGIPLTEGLASHLLSVGLMARRATPTPAMHA